MLLNGEIIRAEICLLLQVEIDSVVIEFLEMGNFVDILACVLIYFMDNLNMDNFYWCMFQFNLFDSLLEQDFVIDDWLVEDSIIVFGIGFNYKVGDILIIILYYIFEDYVIFLESVDGVVVVNGNFFGQFSLVIFNLEGMANVLGIFIGLVSFRWNDIVMRNQKGKEECKIIKLVVFKRILLVLFFILKFLERLGLVICFYQAIQFSIWLDYSVVVFSMAFSCFVVIYWFVFICISNSQLIRVSVFVDEVVYNVVGMSNVQVLVVMVSSIFDYFFVVSVAYYYYLQFRIVFQCYCKFF